MNNTSPLSHLYILAHACSLAQHLAPDIAPPFRRTLIRGVKSLTVHWGNSGPTYYLASSRFQDFTGPDLSEHGG